MWGPGLKILLRAAGCACGPRRRMLMGDWKGGPRQGKKDGLKPGGMVESDGMK